MSAGREVEYPVYHYLRGTFGRLDLLPASSCNFLFLDGAAARGQGNAMSRKLNADMSFAILKIRITVGLMQQLFGRILFALVTATLASSARGAGVTVVTHGFDSSADDWVTSICTNMPGYPTLAGKTTSLYRVSIAKPSGTYAISHTFLGGVQPFDSDSGEIVIALDWSTIDDLFQPSTSEIAGQVATMLLSTDLFPALGGHPLAELPLHLIGHSRGASMMAETARVLGAQGVWVDHLTLLDPYPLSLNGDPSLKNYANVFFTENYHQNDTFPTGVTVGGAYDRLLTTLSTGGYTSAHSDVHLWYEGTINLSPSFTSDGVMISDLERVAWWAEGEQEGTNAGFVYSLIGGGNRFLMTDPAGTAKHVSDGINKMWDFGAGLSANRTALPSNNGSWPSIIRIVSENLGGSVTATIAYQLGPATTNVGTLAICLDSDSNPFNGSVAEVASVMVNGTGTTGVSSTALPVVASPELNPGAYKLFARATMGGHDRYFYAQEPFYIAPKLANARLAGSDFAFSLLGAAGWNVVVESSEDMQTWQALSTNSTTGVWQEVTNAATGFHRFFRALLPGRQGP